VAMVRASAAAVCSCAAARSSCCLWLMVVREPELGWYW
jgi:hypothetical protein